MNNRLLGSAQDYESEESEMVRRTRSLGTLAALLCILLISATPAVATDVAARSQAANTEIRSTGISWQSVMDFKSAALTVSGPEGFLMSREFASGEALEIRAVDKRGHALADGGYTWELRFSPVLEPAVKRALDEARESGDERVVAELKRQGKLPEGAVISGSFRVQSGSIVTPDKVEEQSEVEGTSSAVVKSADKDIVHADDVIAQFSLCVGNDCVNGESFGFDTLRLKENNTRLHFDDTSSTASFPQNDWRLIANDSSNGGANYLAIEDSTAGRQPFRVEAGARANALYVESDGDIGMGTANPAVNVHVVDGNTPTLRLEQDGSSGFTAQTWDLAGNEANFFIRDVTNGSALVFRIEPGSPANAIYIDSGAGNVGLGSTSPDADLDIEANGPIVRYTNTGTGATDWEVFVNGNNGRFNISEVGGNIPFKIFPGADDNLVKLGETSNQVDITGNLVVSGTITPDYVFEPGYLLESIEEHAEYMWTNKHLPAVGAATLRPDGSHAVNVGSRSQSMLEELEKAHIYIEQLHATMKEMQTTVLDLQNRLDKVENGSGD